MPRGGFRERGAPCRPGQGEARGPERQGVCAPLPTTLQALSRSWAAVLSPSPGATRTRSLTPGPQVRPVRGCEVSTAAFPLRPPAARAGPARPPPPPPAPSFRPLSAGRGRGGSPRSQGWLSAGPGPFSPLGPKAPAAGLPGLILLGLRFRPPELLGFSTNRVTRTAVSQHRSYRARLFSSRPPALPEKCGK